MSEAQYQSKLIKQYEAEGYYVLKLISTNKAGIPDLVALKPNDVKFIEVKGVKTPVSKLQEYRIKELKNLGFDAEIKRSEY
jgi:Holliday junction resolvase